MINDLVGRKKNAGISFEGFDNFDNSDVSGTEPGFNDVLDDSGKWSGGVGNFVQDWLVGGLSGAEDAAESLVSACARVQVFKPAVSTFLDLLATDTVRAPFLTHRLSVWSPLVALLLSQITYEDASWWLLDSGASATVLAESCMRAFGIDEPLVVGMPNFKTANGGDVGMRGIPSLHPCWCLKKENKGCRQFGKRPRCMFWLVGFSTTYFQDPFVSVRMVFFANTRQFFFET